MIFMLKMPRKRVYPFDEISRPEGRALFDEMVFSQKLMRQRTVLAWICVFLSVLAVIGWWI